MRAAGEVAVLFYLAVIVIGSFIVLNLFLALLLSSFDVENIKAHGERQSEQIVSRAKLKRRTRNNQVTPMEDVFNSSLQPLASVQEDVLEEPNPEDPTNSSTTLWGSSRSVVFHIVNHYYFEVFIQIMILWSSFMLVFEDSSLHKKPKLEELLFHLSIMFCVVFGAEASMKIFALGWRGYFSSHWNILDFLVLLISIVGLASANSDLKVLRVLRTLRALRPLRAISRWEGMKIVVNALLASIPSILNVLLVCGLSWVIFSIMGVQFFGGKFGRCVDSDGVLKSVEEVPDRATCEILSNSGEDARWVNPQVNFDNSANGLLALFQVATFEGWMELFEYAVDARGIDKQPKFEAHVEAYYFFVVFIIIGAFFSLNLFVGVIIDRFNTLKKEMAEAASGLFLTEGQKKYLKVVRNMLKSKPQRKVEFSTALPH